jgi:hypothetical protein
MRYIYLLKYLRLTPCNSTESVENNERWKLMMNEKDLGWLIRFFIFINDSLWRGHNRAVGWECRIIANGEFEMKWLQGISFLWYRILAFMKRTSKALWIGSHWKQFKIMWHLVYYNFCIKSVHTLILTNSLRNWLLLTWWIMEPKSTLLYSQQPTHFCWTSAH